MSIFYLSLRDFFSKAFLKFSFLPLLVSILTLSFCVFYVYDFFLSYINDLDHDAAMAWFFGLSIVHFSLTLLSAVGGFFIVVFASVFMAVFIISFLTPYIVKKINKKYYNYHIQKEVSFFEILIKFFKILFITCILFVIATFSLIIPFISIAIYYVIFYYLFHKFLILDVSSCVLDEEKFQNFHKKSSPLYYKISTFVFFLFSSIPLIGLFTQVFYVIFLSHMFYQKELQLKANG